MFREGQDLLATTGSPLSAQEPPPDQQFIGVFRFPVPPLWPKDPVVWFTHVEGQFHLHRITFELTRYHHAISVLSPEIADVFADVLAAPPLQDPYDKFKALLFARMTPSVRK